MAKYKDAFKKRLATKEPEQQELAFSENKYGYKQDRLRFGIYGAWLDLDSDSVVADVEVLGEMCYGLCYLYTNTHFVGEGFMTRHDELSKLPWVPKAKIKLSTSGTIFCDKGFLWLNTTAYHLPCLYIKAYRRYAKLQIERINVPFFDSKKPLPVPQPPQSAV